MANKTDVNRAEAFIFDRPSNERRISGALRSCICAHGPVTPKWIGSAAKRIESEYRNAYKRQLRDLPEPDLTRLIESVEKQLAGLREARAGQMIDAERGWCGSCGNAVVDVAGGFDTCASCTASI